jgi:hypothetical protein
VNEIALAQLADDMESGLLNTWPSEAPYFVTLHSGVATSTERALLESELRRRGVRVSISLSDEFVLSMGPECRGASR